MEEVDIERIDWSSFEYEHKEHNTDWYWYIGLITLIFAISLIWTKNYIFAIFIILSGVSLFLFSSKHPQTIEYSILEEYFSIGKNKYNWESIKGFDIVKRNGQNKLLIEIDKYFLPVYTILIPEELVEEIKDSLIQVVPLIKLQESGTMLFVEKLGL